MNNIPMILLSTLLWPAMLMANEGENASKDFAPGLIIKEYARHDLQSDSREQYQLDREKFGEPLGISKIAESVTPWYWKTARNAIAQGYLEIPVDGEYAFVTNSFYDRNALFINDELVCAFRDGESQVNKIQLKKGHVKFTSIGFVESRGEKEGIDIQWKPPGQEELSSIPTSYLKHEVPHSPTVSRAVQPGQLSTHLIMATNDYIVDAYHNGVKIPEAQRKMIHDHYGATVEKIQVDVQPGDTLVFHVVSNRLRWGGSRYFAVAGLLSTGDYGFVTDPGSSDWSVCDDPLQSNQFIQQSDYGIQNRALIVTKPWDVGDELMRRYAGEGYPGQAVWGNNASTWIKYVATEKKKFPVKVSQESNPFGPQPTDPKQPNKDKPIASRQEVTSPLLDLCQQLQPKPAQVNPVSKPPQWPVQIISATYGTGGKNADVTPEVRQFVEHEKLSFVVTPKDLGQDPNPYWNKDLHIVYMKDGVRREQRRGENETVLPHSFYAPQDKAELKSWITGSRWRGNKDAVQFNPDGTLTGPLLEKTLSWEAVSNNTLRITWASDRSVEYVMNHEWNAFRNLKDESDSYRELK